MASNSADGDSALESLFGTTGIAALVTLKRDGRPQISNISYLYDPAKQVFSVSITETRAKTKNMRRDGRVSLHVNGSSGWNFAVAEGRAELGATTVAPDDAAADDLVELYRAIGGKEHPDWDEYRAAMVADQRLVLRVHVDRFYGAVQRS
ncbi:PPOX class F420-dependent oxidoreductase [Antrihabitans cavernicola]|uniref:PPOX class F420-dependent oxidoreductase n=1 Tax=Antrihabitans cavernicola TaxID=2495913 RepID=A0A5A7SBS7_9NOCA|nr:PPOX class F420-dependent oxidoreductase [Spelaeibacter cavernicola]KAA0022602.1 PPOX class F420-dependent oxidoreductase [Spelaeibacter cavernicola]